MTYEHLCGWSREHAPEAYAQFSHLFSPLAITAEPERALPPIWHWSKLVLGQHIPTWFQETGDCVAHGANNALQYLTCVQIGLLRQEQKFRFGFPPYIYGTSRVQIGRGRMGRKAGSTGAWAVAAMQKYGELFLDDVNVPKYSGSLSDRWGIKGPPEEFLALGSRRPVLKFTKITTVDELRLALKNYRPVTYAIDWYYHPEQTRIVEGQRVMRKGRRMGGHQTCMLYWNDDLDAAFNLNSWGDVFEGPTPLDEPPGGAYILRRDIEDDMSGGDSEVYSIDCLEADPAEAFYGLFGGGAV